jgi:hypothetical protein
VTMSDADIIAARPPRGRDGPMVDHTPPNTSSGTRHGISVPNSAERAAESRPDRRRSPREPAPEPVRGTGARRRLLWLIGVIVSVIFAWSRSLLLTSDPIDETQRQIVSQAVMRLRTAGFSNEVLMLRHVANYRATDNWWNQYLGHRDAYAATNFPLGVVTLYPEFFKVAVDDTERASILLHEARHLLGRGEEAALEAVWHGKRQLGWTVEDYGETQVWKNTREWTEAALPALFSCGPDHNADCTP